jgi:hypothetical protein
LSAQRIHAETSNGELLPSEPYEFVVGAEDSFSRSINLIHGIFKALRIFPFPFLWNGIESLLGFGLTTPEKEADVTYGPRVKGKRSFSLYRGGAGET